ncbi:MAG: hypothetical protein H0W84_08325 [Bacteroidetes bacterium]|nr:hypothetical protein [Bacteroidota bacterium]
MEQNEITNGTEPATRPVFLKVLCILTFISTGAGCLISLITPLMADTIVAFMQSSEAYDEIKMAEQIRVLQAGWNYYAPMFLLSLISLIGAILMWNLKKIGFHLYTSANLALLFLPMLILGVAVNWGGILLTVAFITMYAVNFKHLSK